MLVIVAPAVACASGSRPAAESSPAPPGGDGTELGIGAARGMVRERETTWIRVDGDAEPRARAQMAWVTQLLDDGGQHACSATWIGERALLTAAHCVDGDRAVRLAAGEVIGLDGSGRACGHGECAAPFQEGDYGSIPFDIATLHATSTTAPAGTPPGLAHPRGGRLRGAYLMSGLHGEARPVCRVETGAGMGEGPGTVDRGESGSAVLAFHGGAPVILGVVSHRRDSGEGWLFALVPTSVPWPSGAGPAPEPLDVSEDDLEEIPACER